MDPLSHPKETRKEKFLKAIPGFAVALVVNLGLTKNLRLKVVVEYVTTGDYDVVTVLDVPDYAKNLPDVTNLLWLERSFDFRANLRSKKCCGTLRPI